MDTLVLNEALLFLLLDVEFEPLHLIELLLSLLGLHAESSSLVLKVLDLSLEASSLSVPVMHELVHLIVLLQELLSLKLKRLHSLPELLDLLSELALRQGR